MEHKGVSFTTRTRFDRLTDAYRCFLTDSRPSQSAADVAAVIFSGVCGLVPGEDRARAAAEYGYDSADLTCIGLSLVGRIASSLASQSLSPPVTLYCVDILRVLVEDLDLMSQLVHHFQAEDQIISQLAAKSISMCVFYQLQKSRTVSPVWEQKCVQAFYGSPPSTELDACLWSLTEVLKRLLKGGHQEVLGKLLAAFDSSLGALCSRFLAEECWVGLTCDSHWGTTFCLLFDLLEVLTASSQTCGPGVCLKSQRITHIHSSALLALISCSSEYFVKKRALLLLKRTILQKPGEDWALGEAPFHGLKHEHFNPDMSMLAQCVVSAVADDWIQSVQVESASFFGGTRHTRGDEGQKPDSVMLRAVSVLLLKSVELHIPTATVTGVESAKEVYGYLQSLWGFLRRYSVQLMEVTHLCCWVSLLFGEQDDDMLEAAKALLSIFLNHRLCSGLGDLAVLDAACAFGCNPHCHFLLLLESISFDHSILLDFLISTEACFLEYFVRYLKYLRDDWEGFTAACGRIRVSDCNLSLQQSLSASCSGDMFTLAYKGELDQVEFSSCVQSTNVISPVKMISLGAGLRLVDYDSSDESDPENMEVSQDKPEVYISEKGRFSALDVKQEISGPLEPIRQKQYVSSNSTELLSESLSTLERRQETSSLPLLQSEQTSSPNMAPLSGQVTSETLARAVRCMSQLREVVTRMQTKKLFPYNPSSLLKLLSQVDNCSQQSDLSHFNK